LQIGYVLTRSTWGNGYVTEAVCEMIRFAFKEMRMHRIEASCDPRNERSIRVVERCGMTHDATFRENEICKGERVSNEIYAIVHG
jgi:RimJ/RimL family protein N-acetyltransferase